MADDVQTEINSMKLQIGLLERDVNSLIQLNERISESIEKIQELNVNFVRMISLCEQRHTIHDSIEKDLKVDMKDIDDRLHKLNIEVNERLSQFEIHLSAKLDALREDILESNATPEAPDWLKSKWMIIGGTAVLGFLLGNIDNIVKLFSPQ